MLDRGDLGTGDAQQESAVVVFDEIVFHLEGQHKGAAHRVLAAVLHAEVAGHVEDAYHVAHGAPADLVDAAVVGTVLAGVRVGEHHVQALIRGEDAHPFDLVHLGGEEGHELPQGVHVLVDHLVYHQVVVHVGVVIHLHEGEGEVAGDPALTPADDHIGGVKDPVGVHVVVDGGAVGLFGPAAVELQNGGLVLLGGIGQAGLVAKGADITGLGLVENVLVAVAVAHASVERGVKGVEAADRRAQLGIVPHQHLEQRAGDPLFLVEKVGGDIGRSAHGHHHTSDVEGEIHHQDGTQQGSSVIETAEVTSLVRTVQFAFHILQKCRRCFGREGSDHISGQLVHLGGENESDIHILLIPF